MKGGHTPEIFLFEQIFPLPLAGVIGGLELGVSGVYLILRRVCKCSGSCHAFFDGFQRGHVVVIRREVYGC